MVEVKSLHECINLKLKAMIHSPAVHTKPQCSRSRTCAPRMGLAFSHTWVKDGAYAASVAFVKHEDGKLKGSIFPSIVHLFHTLNWPEGLKSLPAVLRFYWKIVECAKMLEGEKTPFYPENRT